MITRKKVKSMYHILLLFQMSMRKDGLKESLKIIEEDTQTSRRAKTSQEALRLSAWH